MNVQDKEFLKPLSNVLHSKVKDSINIDDFEIFFSEVVSQSIYGLYAPYIDQFDIEELDLSKFYKYIGRQSSYLS